MVSTTTELSPPVWLALLSPRECEVLARLATGLTTAEIADELFLSPATVKTHTATLLSKVGVKNRVQLAIAAYRAGLVD